MQLSGCDVGFYLNAIEKLRQPYMIACSSKARQSNVGRNWTANNTGVAVAGFSTRTTPE